MTTFTPAIPAPASMPQVPAKAAAQASRRDDQARESEFRELLGGARQKKEKTGENAARQVQKPEPAPKPEQGKETPQPEQAAHAVAAAAPTVWQQPQPEEQASPVPAVPDPGIPIAQAAPILRPEQNLEAVPPAAPAAEQQHTVQGPQPAAASETPKSAGEPMILSAQATDAAAQEAQLPPRPLQIEQAATTQTEQTAQATQGAQAGQTGERFGEMVQNAVQELQDKTQPKEETPMPNPKAVGTEKPADERLTASRQSPETRAARQEPEPAAKPEAAAATARTEQQAPPDQPKSPEASSPKPLFIPLLPQARQVEAQLTQSLKDQKTEFHLQLKPQELGRIDVKMIMEGGKLAVEITAATARAAELLLRQTDGLMASLRQGNVDVQSVQVVQQTQNQNSHMEQEFNMNGSQHGQGDNQETDPYRSGGQNREQSPDPVRNDALQPEKLLDRAV